MLKDVVCKHIVPTTDINNPEYAGEQDRGGFRSYDERLKVIKRPQKQGNGESEQECDGEYNGHVPCLTHSCAGEVLRC